MTAIQAKSHHERTVYGLKALLNLFTLPENWTKGKFWKTRLANGQPLSYPCHCLVGGGKAVDRQIRMDGLFEYRDSGALAIAEIARDPELRAYYVADEAEAHRPAVGELALYRHPIFKYNDSPKRTFREIRALLQRSLARAEKRLTASS